MQFFRITARELPNCDKRADTRATEPEHVSRKIEMVGEELLHSSHISDSDREGGMVSHHVEELSGVACMKRHSRAVDLNVINPSPVAQHGGNRILNQSSE